MARDIRIGMEVRGKGVERGIQRKRLRMRKGKEPYARAENRMAKKMIILWMDEQLMRCMRKDPMERWMSAATSPHPSSGIEETGKHRIWSGLCRYCQCESRELSETRTRPLKEERPLCLVL